MKKYLLYLLPALILLACNNDHNGGQTEMARQVDSLMTYSYNNGLFNGAVLVSKDNEVIYRNSFGYANIEKEEMLLPESSFYLASVSKQFTTMAIMILKERGALSYDDKLSKYFPDFPAYADSVSIRHMMTHSSGIPDHYRLNAYRPGLTNEDVYKLLVKQEQLDFSPGTESSYSNGAYVLLSMIVEKLDGPFHEFMQSNIFEPLQMDHSLVYDRSEPEVHNRVIGYNAVGEKDDYEIFTTGAGGMYSNVDDLHKWDQALRENKLVSKETLQEAYQPYVLATGDTSYYGFGWAINLKKHWVGHSGGLAGFRTYLRRYPDKGNSFMLLSNKGDAVAMGDINDGLAKILDKETFELPAIPLSSKINARIETEGLEKALEWIKQQNAQGAAEFEYDEDGINALGYAYLRREEIDEALAVFKLNTEIRPNSGNTYDSYGEALLAKGDTLAAIENYSLSVEKNPNNQNGIDILEALGVDLAAVLPSLELTPSQLNAFVGAYELEADLVLNIIREDNRLFIHPTGQGKSELFVAGESRFYSKIVDAQITFNKSASGEVVSLTLHQGGDHEAPKME